MRYPTLAVLALVAAPPAQAGASPNYFVPAIEFAPGADANSSTFRMVTAVGAGVVPVTSTSTNFRIRGGFAATLNVSAANRPWLTSVAPKFVTPRGQSTLSLYGIGLGANASPTIQIGTTTATATSVSSFEITTKMPFQAGPPSKPSPGWNTIRITSTNGTTTLTNAIGVLPMLWTDPAPGPNTEFDLIFKGTKGDTILWVLGLPPIAPIPIGAHLHGLAINPIVTMPALAIPGPSGELRLPIQPTNYQGPFFAQALFLSNNPGYAPGSFSNVFKFD